MPGVKADDDRDSPLLTNGGGKNGDGSSHRKPKSDDSASFLRAARGGNTEKVLEYLKNGTDINTCNANGLNALHLASKEGHVHIVQDLLARGAKIDSATKKGNTALHIASLAGQHEVVKILVSHSASVNVQSQNGFTPLYMAAQENHDEVVRFLLASGASQSLATEDGFTPLAVALQQGHDKVVAVLLENDTRGKVRLPALHIAAKKDDTKAAALLLQNDHNPDVTSKSGFTPLHIAAHYGNENIAVVLLQRGADVNYSAKHNITPLHVAAKWGKGNMVGLLLDKGANLEARTRDGLTPLHCAARSGHENVVDMMLQRGAPISAKTKNGLAPLHMASQGDHVDAARILLHHKAPVDEVTVDYLTALHVAAHCGHVRVAKLLLDRKADPNSRALNGFTPLHIACKKNRIKVVELLLKYGASIEATTESGLTPLHVASFMGCMNIVIFLIQHQASPDEATVRGETPLHLAARANQTDIIRILLRNGAKVDARAREQQTPLHIASRLGNVDIVVLLLQSGAQVDAVTKDLYTALHIAAKEGQEEVASILMDHGASMSAATKKGFTPLHLSAKYGNMKVAKLLIAKDAPVDAEGKNGVTPLHVAVHYDNQNVAMLLLDKSASPHACAKNGYTPLHISAKKNQLDIAKTLLDYGAKVDAESKAGFSPLHLAGQEGHIEIASLLIKQGADVNAKAKNGLTPIHLCAQEDKVEVAQVLVDNGADCDAETKAGYTPLHVAAHFGQMNMVKFLLGHGVRVDVQNELGYSPLHQAAQQGHSQIVNLLLEANASPNTISNNGQTALSIAQKLGYISVVETLKVVTDTVVTTTTTTTVEEKYKVLAPESMQETFMSDSEDEGGEEPTNDQSYKYLTTEEMLKIPDDSMPMDITSDTNEKKDSMNRSTADPYQQSIEQTLIRMENSKDRPDVGRKFDEDYKSDNVALSVPPVSAGKLKWKSFLVSFMVDARGGAMRGCRHSGVRVIIPPRKAPMPMRVTCRYLKKDKLIHPPPLMEGEAIASRVLELGPAGAKFLGPVIIEVPHFASLRGKEREIVILRSDNGESWREHTLEATEEAVQEVLQDSFDEGETTQLEDLNTNRITRILTTDFPQYFAIISRIRQEVHAIGPEGGVVNSTVVPQVQAVFPQGALTKKIKVGLQAQPIPPELTAKLLGNRVAVSPIVTVEPRRRKFHKPITLTIPVPVAASKGMINQYSGDTPTLRLLCSITGGTTRAQWEDVTGSTPLTFVNDCVNFTTTVSARFWLMDCRNVAEATKMATSLYKEAIHVPFMAKFCVFSKRHELLEARMRVFCMTDDKEDKTLEHQEHFHEVAKSRDVEVLEGKTHHLEFFGNLFPVTKSGDQLSHKFHAFRENRLPFTVRVKDPNNDSMGRISFFREPKQARSEAQQPSICNLNISLPDDISPEPGNVTDQDILAIQAKYSFLREAGYGKFDTIHRADLRVSDISNLLGSDWIKLARELEIDDQDINLIISEYPDNVGQQAMVMLRLWLNTEGNKATGNALEKALKQCDRQDIVNKCMFNIEMVTDNNEQEIAQGVLAREEGYDAFKKELSPVNNSTLKPLTRDYSIDVNVDDSDYTHENYAAAERLAGITEEISSRSDTINETSLKQEEATSVYEREEHKYVAEEKEFASSYHKEVQQEQMSTNQITQSQVLESTHRENNIITEKTENRNDYVHEEMKKMSIEEKQSMKFVEGDRVMEKTTESKMEEEHKEKEMYNNETSETKQSKTEEREDGTVLILTENKKQSREAFMTESHDTRHYEQAEIMTGVEPSEAVRVTESKFESETFDQGLEEQYSANVEERIETCQKEGTISPSQPRPASSSFDDEDSEPESPRSPSPKVSPGSKSPSPRVSQHNSHPDLPRQSSSPYGESSGASSNGSSRNDLDNMINKDVAPLMKETDQELLDEMIVKDVPESESSTDPVKKFEEANPIAGIDSIQEDQEDASDSECKDQSLNILALATSTPHKSHDTLSFNKSSSEPSPEMPNENDLKDEDDKSPVTSGLAAPDSKDSLEVQLYSNCEDLSEHFSGKEESIDDNKQRPDTSESEDEREPTVNEKDITSPVLESVDFKIEDDIQKKESFEIIEKTEELKIMKEETFTSTKVKDVKSDDSSDNEFDIVSKTEIDEAKEQEVAESQLKESTKLIQQSRALINIQSPSSSDTESESDHEKSRHSSADHSETSENRDIAESTDDVDEIQESPVVLRSQKISANNALNAGTKYSRPSSSDYSDIEHHADKTQDVAAASVKDKISIFNQEPIKVDSRPSSSDFSEIVEKKTVIESDTDPAVIEDKDMVQSIKDKITKFNADPIGSTDTEPRYSRPSSSDYSETYEKPKLNDLKKDEIIVKEELVISTESVKDRISKINLEPSMSSETELETQKVVAEKVERAQSVESVQKKISKFNFDSTLSSETEPEIEQRNSRPASSDYSDINDKKAIFESTMSSETEPENERKQSRPSSSDYSDIYDKKTVMEPKIEEIAEKDEIIKPIESVKDRISKFNLESTMSSETEPDVEQRHSRPSSSDYSDIQEKKAIFESKENIAKSSDNISIQKEKVNISATSSDTEPEAEHKQSRPSSSDYSEIFDKKVIVDTRNEDISEVTEQTVVAQSVKEKITKLNLESATSTDTEPRQSRPTSSDYSDIYDKEKIIETQIEEKKEIILDSTKKDITEKVEQKTKFEPGILQVIVHKAMDLVNQDMLGKSDPYVKLKFRGQEFKSKTINNSLTPEWNFSTDLLISEVYDSYINIEVFDEDYGQDNFEGTVSILLSEAISKPKEEGEWYTLTGCSQGKVFVSTVYTAMSSSQGSLKAFAQPEVEPSKTRPYSSSSSEEGATQDQVKDLHQSSSDSSVSNRRDKSNQEIQRQEAIDIDDKIIDSKNVPKVLKTQSSSDYSDTDDEPKRRESSSDYDSVSKRGKKRPDSFISDTSSDYDSLSNVGSRRPQSFLLDDEYDIITEEEAAESEKQQKTEISNKEENDTSSSSESEGPDAKEAGKRVQVIPPPAVQQQSSIEDKEQDGELNGISVPQTLDIPYPTPSSVASSSPILSSDLHAEQSSISVEVEKSTVINSNTLEEIDPLVRDFENISHSNNFTKHIDAKTEKRIIVEETKVVSSVSFQSTSRRSSSSCSSLDQAQRDGSSESERSQDLGTIDTEENSIPTNPLSPQSVKLPEGEGDTSPSFEKVSVKNMQDIFEGISKSSVSAKAMLKPDSSVEQSSDSHTTVRQITKHQDSTATDSSDCEISSLHERQKSSSSSESEVCNMQLKRSGTDSSDYEIHSTVYLQKGTGSFSPEKPVEDNSNAVLLATEEPEKPELSPKEKATFEAFVKPALDENEDVVDTFEHKPMPLKKQLQKINSTDLLTRQIKEDMYEQVMSQEDDSVMSESTIENNIFQQTSDYADSMHKIEEKFLDSAISMGRTPSSNDALECDSLAEYDVPLPLKTDSDSSISVQQAVENEIEEPEWELVETAEAGKTEGKSIEPISKRSMTPEQALEVATEIVQNVQSEAIKKYEELIKTNQLPKPQPDSKFTPETKEKVQEYLKELEESEQYDVVAAELIHKVALKKEERLKHLKHQDLSVDITDDDEHKSEGMLNEMRNELRRNSISVTDEDLTTELTHELLQEKNIEEMKKHLEDSSAKFERVSNVSSDFRFQTAFRAHFVSGNEEINSEFESRTAGNQESEDIWAEESKVIFRRDLKTLKDKKSDNDSNSSGSKQNLQNITDRRSGTDQEGYSSSGDTYFSTVDHLASGTISGQSRPTSSDMDAMLSAVSERSMTTTGNTEFLTAHDHSAAHEHSSGDTSHYFTAGSSMSSHASVRSSESSGHLGSIEVSECSETLVESSLEYEQRLDDGSETPAGVKPLDESSVEEFELGTSYNKRYSMESSSSTEQSRHSVEYSTTRRTTHMRNSSTSSIPQFDMSPQEMQCLAEDDVDGCCFSRDKLEEEDEEKQSLLPDKRFSIPDILASRFSESRETLSSSVLTLSSVSEATVMVQEPNSLTASQLSLNPFMDPTQKTTDLLTGSITTLSSSTHSSWSTNVNPSPPKTDNSGIPSSLEELQDEQDQLFPMPRVRSFEGTHSVHVPFPQQMSVDLGSEYDSRPNSELKDIESRPLSTDRMSRASSNEALNAVSDKRSYSIDETVSDNLRVIEPYSRPKSPMPQSSIGSDRTSSESEDRKRISFSAPIRTISPCPVQPRQCLQSTESFETEIAFSKHFTQVFDDTEFESNDIIKTNENKDFEPIADNVDLTPESQLTSDSIETSQGEEYVIHPDHKLASPKQIFDLDDQDDLLVGSPPMVSRPLGVKYWPPVDNLDQDLDALGPLDKRTITRSESDDNSESRLELDNDMIEKEVEDGKRWLESQFDGNQQDDYGQFGYGQPLDQILEEEEDRYSHSSEDVKELQRFKESLSSTPDFDQIINKRHQVGRSADQDDISMGSLTEFERLEREVALESISGSGSHGSLGSNDSLEVYANGNSNEKIDKIVTLKPTNLAVKIINQSKSGTGDDVSVSSYNSVRSFEMMEAACKEAEQIEIKAKQQEEVLSEIEEGHESQDSESAETISECEEEKSDKDYEDRLFEIDSIIKQAQANVEKFDKNKKPADEISLRDIMGRPESRTESIASNDSLDCAKLPDLPKEEAPLRRQLSMPARIQQSCQPSRTTSVTSLQSMTSITSIASVSTLTQFDADSIRERDIDLDDLDEAEDLMQASVDSLEHRGKSPENTMITSTDSLEGAQRKQDNMTISTDSIENANGNSRKEMMTVSMDSLDGIANKDGTMERKKELPHDYDGATSILITSTDSLESSSTNTRATASMLSSMTSQASETLVADDEFEHDDEDSRSVRKFLIDQGNLQLDDSDDSATYSYSSPQMQHKVFQKDLSDVSVTKYQVKDGRFGSLENFGSSEEILETEEIDEKGNIIIKKVIQKRIFQEPRKIRISDRKQEGYVSDLSEKRDDSCEETIEDIDEFGKRRRYVIKRTIEQPKPETLGIVHERRQQKGLSPIGEIFKSVTDTPQQSKLEAKRQPIHHTERMTKVFDAPPSTPSPPASPPASTFRSQIPIRKH